MNLPAKLKVVSEQKLYYKDFLMVNQTDESSKNPTHQCVAAKLN